jgi:glyoxylase-like metal-dependent hydrolase (beta-lactamase superfamily II)
MSLEVRQLTVGPIAENCFILRKEGTDKALVIDPGEEPERILAEIEQTGAEVEAILITHCHFDHVGAVAPLARATVARRHHVLHDARLRPL